MKKLSEAVDRFARNHPGFGVPHLMKVIVIGSLIVYFLMRFSAPAALSFLAFTPSAVLRGEVWRLVTFLFIPGGDNLLLAGLMLYFYYWIGETLEREWGTAKFNLYYFSGVVLTLLAAFLLHFTRQGEVLLMGAYYVNLSMFFAFASLFPDAQVMLFFVIPMKMKWLAWLDGALFAVDILRSALALNWSGVAVPIMALLNFVLFFWPEISRLLGRGRASAAHRASPKTIQFRQAARRQEKKARHQGYHHKCEVCGRTDADSPTLQFRYCSRCAGYHCFCEDHIFDHQHFTF